MSTTGLGLGTHELINRMVGDQTEINGELFANGTVSRILAKGSLRTKAMVRSGETNQLAMKKFGSQILGHTWDPTLDEISFKLQVDVSTKRELVGTTD